MRWLFNLFRPRLKPWFPDLREVREICIQLWPDEYPAIGAGPMSQARLWLNEKTGLSVPGDARASFSYWLPRLQEMAAQRG